MPASAAAFDTFDTEQARNHSGRSCHGHNVGKGEQPTIQCLAAEERSARRLVKIEASKGPFGTPDPDRQIGATDPAATRVDGRLVLNLELGGGS